MRLREYHYSHIKWVTSDMATAVVLTIGLWRFYLELKHRGRPHDHECFWIDWWPGAQLHWYWWRIAIHFRCPIKQLPEDDE